MIRAIFLVAAFCLRNWCFKRLSVLNIGKIVITPPCKTVWTLQNPRIFSRWSNSTYNVLIRRNCRVCLHQNLERKHVWRIFIYSVSWLAVGDVLRYGKMITVKTKEEFSGGEHHSPFYFVSQKGSHHMVCACYHAIHCYVLFIFVMCLSRGFFQCHAMSYVAWLHPVKRVDWYLRYCQRRLLSVLLCHSEKSVLYCLVRYITCIWWCSEYSFTIDVLNTEFLEYTLFSIRILFCRGWNSYFPADFRLEMLFIVNVLRL